MVGSSVTERLWKKVKAMKAAGLAAMLAGAMVPPPAAARHGEENRLVSYQVLDRPAIENLQRWVAAGHEDWCKDPRLVAAGQLRRIAADFDAGATELSRVESGGSAPDGGSAEKLSFEWTPLDGRATFRVTVERFAWLLPIAKQADSLVWVPTVTEIRIHE